MLMMQASTRLFQLWRTDCLPAIAEKFVMQTLQPVLSQISTQTLRSQNQDGSWGKKGFREETAYAILVLAYSLHHPFMSDVEREAHAGIKLGRSFLTSEAKVPREDLWVEKVTYASEVLSESYILAASNISLPILCRDSPLSVTEPAICANGCDVSEADLGDTNGVDSHGSDNLKDTSINSPNPSHLNAANDSSDISIDTGNDGTTTNIKTRGSDFPMVNGANGINSYEPHANTVSREHVIQSTDASNAQQNGTIRSEVKSKPAWSPENDRILLGAFDYLEQQPGKDIRTQFIQAFNAWLDVSFGSLDTIAKVVKMLHTASLLIDDIEDSSVLRRGVPVAHSIFGIAQTMNSGNYVYFLALQEVQKLRQPQATNIFIQELLNLHRGQGMDLYWRDSLICPSEQEYLDMVGNKTGGLFRLAIKLMQVESPHNRNCEQLVDLMGQIFQIRDDYMNLHSTAYTHNKGLCEDLTEGKFSFPIIHSIRSDPGNHQLVNILKQKSSEERIKRYAVTIMERTGSFDYTKGCVKDLRAQASGLIESYEAQGWGSGEGVRQILARIDID